MNTNLPRIVHLMPKVAAKLIGYIYAAMWLSRVEPLKTALNFEETALSTTFGYVRYIRTH